MSEPVEHVDERDRVLGIVERHEAVRENWPHRIATTICRDREGRILVLRRAETLSRFPGHYDVMASRMRRQRSANWLKSWAFVRREGGKL